MRLTALGRDNTQRAGTLFGSWGLALWIARRPLDAERVLRRAIAIGQRNQAEAGVPSWLLLNYARALLDLGRVDEAADYAERVYAKAQTSGDQFLERTLWTLTAVYCSQGNLERGAQMLSEIESMLRRNLVDGHTAFGALASQEAPSAQASGKTQTALDLANQALAIAEASIQEGREGVVYLTFLLGWRSGIQLQLGHSEQAAGDARLALKRALEWTKPRGSVVRAVEDVRSFHSQEDRGTFSVLLGRAYA